MTRCGRTGSGRSVAPAGCRPHREVAPGLSLTRGPLQLGTIRVRETPDTLPQGTVRVTTAPRAGASRRGENVSTIFRSGKRRQVCAGFYVRESPENPAQTNAGASAAEPGAGAPWRRGRTMHHGPHQPQEHLLPVRETPGPPARRRWPAVVTRAGRPRVAGGRPAALVSPPAGPARRPGSPGRSSPGTRRRPGSGGPARRRPGPARRRPADGPRRRSCPPRLPR